MNFNIELTDFPTVLHENIYTRARRFMPLLSHKKILEIIPQEQWVLLHGLVMDRLSDMYQNPEKYKLPAGKLEKFLNGRELHIARKEETAKYKKLFKEITSSVSKQLELLAQEINIAHSELQPAISKIPLFHRLTEDYRCILPNWKYKPTHDDVFATLFAGQQVLAYELHKFAMGYKMRTSPNANWGIVYNRNGNQVLTIAAGGDTGIELSVKVMAKNKNDDITVLEYALSKEPQEFQDTAFGHMSGCDANRCTHCSTFYSDNYVTILGKRHQMCGAGIISYNFYKPNSTEMAMVKRLIEMRCEVNQ